MKTYHPESRAAIWISVLVAISFLWGTQPVRAGGDAEDEVSRSIRPEAIRADMRFLADDLLEGRQTGTRGDEIAANFMAAEFEAMGLEPAGENGTYFQGAPAFDTTGRRAYNLELCARRKKTSANFPTGFSYLRRTQAGQTLLSKLRLFMLGSA